MRLTGRIVRALAFKRARGLTVYCSTLGCRNYMVTAERDGRPWSCRSCEDEAARQDVIRMEARDADGCLPKVWAKDSLRHKP